MADNSSKDPKSVKKPVFQKPIIPNFPGTKAPVNFKPTARMGTINRGRR